MFHEYTKEELARKSKEEAERIAYMATSYGRFWDRIETYKLAYQFLGARMFVDLRNKGIRFTNEDFRETVADNAKYVGYAVHAFWWVTHNAVAHPLIAFLPIKPTFRFHDYTSDKINLK